MTEAPNFDQSTNPELRENLNPGVKVGVYLPRYAITNEMIEGWDVTTNSGKLTNERILKRVGAKRRFKSDVDEGILDMGVRAFSRADAFFIPEAVLFTTSHPTGQDLASNFVLGMGFDIDREFLSDFHFACSGFVQTLVYMKENQEKFEGKKVVIVASEIYSRTVVDLRDKNILEADPTLSQTIFSDGAAVFVGQLGKDFTILAANSKKLPQEMNGFIKMPIIESKMSENAQFCKVAYSPTFWQDGEGVYLAVRNLVPNEIEKTINDAGLTPEDIDFVIPHQGSRHVVEGGFMRNPKMRELGLNEKVVMDIEDGNFSSASIPKAMEKLIRQGDLKKGMKVVVAGFGAGLYSATAIVQFN